MSRLNIARMWQAETGRRFLWLPVCFAAGIACYFALPFEPSRGILLASFMAAFGLFIAAALLPRARALLIVCALMEAGFCWSGIYTGMQQVTVMPEEMSPRPMQGIVRDLERTEHGFRITLDEVTIKRLPPEKTPQRIRLSLRFKTDSVPELPRIGQRVDLLAGLMPPMGPALKGGFDFARYFYFRDIGAVGYGLPPWKLLPQEENRSIANRFLQWRFELTDRIIHALDTRHGPIAAGLITGEDRAMVEEDFDALKAANLYHIIAISGGHMVIITGMIFIGLRSLFLMFPGGQHPAVKSWAAAATLVLVTFYLLVTGMPPSAVRAYAMIVLVLLAVILRRRVDAMRSIALVFWLMLILDPSDLFEPGFGLSFAATLAIVALVEVAIMKRWYRPGQSWLLTLAQLFLFSVMITIVAEGATTPLVIAQFNQLSVYGVFANALATPLVSFFLMPLVGMYFLLLPLGMESIALTGIDYGIGALLWIAHTVASMPGALIYLPAPPGIGLALFVLGLIWLCLWRTQLRYLGIIMMLAGLSTLAFVKLPDVLIGPQGKQVAVITPEGYALAKGRAGTMIPELWAHGLGQKELLQLPRENAYFRCDAVGCVARVRETVMALPNEALAVLEDCHQADIVVSPLRMRCERPLLNPRGFIAFWLEDPWRAETSADWQGNRPWSAIRF